MIIEIFRVVFLFYLCKYLYDWNREDVLSHCPRKITDIVERPPSFQEWANTDDRTEDHFESMFNQLEPTRLQDTTSASDDLQLVDYGAIIEDTEVSKMDRVRIQRRIIQHPELDRYLRAGTKAEREAIWATYFKDTDDRIGVPLNELELFRLGDSHQITQSVEVAKTQAERDAIWDAYWN